MRLACLSGFSDSGLWSSNEHKSWESLSKRSDIGFMARLQSCYHSAAERGTALKGKKIRAGIKLKEKIGKGDIITIIAIYFSLMSYIFYH